MKKEKDTNCRLFVHHVHGFVTSGSIDFSDGFLSVVNCPRNIQRRSWFAHVPEQRRPRRSDGANKIGQRGIVKHKISFIIKANVWLEPNGCSLADAKR